MGRRRREPLIPRIARRDPRVSVDA
ncbi:hypothetical protein MICRO8M_60299 [Microbacterium sp. 8M]|nr:hypothetical protein MICRO8M_60299 [Microbacterium sp. 8M]